MKPEDLLRRYRKQPLAVISDWKSRPTFTGLDYGPESIKKIIPHRSPFLFLDRLIGLDLGEGEETIFGERFISGDDPVFSGHFPGNPIYPGSLQMEMAGQLGLCLTYFATHERNSIPEDARPVSVRATKVLGALFLAPILPDTQVSLCSRKLAFDGIFGSVISQVTLEDRVCCVSISEVIFLDS